MTTNYIKRMQELAGSHEDFSSLLPVVAFDEETETFVMDDGYIGFSIMFNPLSGISGNTDKQLESLLNADFPDDSLLQISLIGSPDIDMNNDGFLYLRGIPVDEDQRLKKYGDEPIPVLDRLMIERHAFIKKSVKEPLDKGGLKTRNFICVLSVKIPTGEIPTEKDIEKAVTIKNQITSTLKNTQILPTVMNERDWIRVMSTLLNWNDDALWHIDNEPDGVSPLRNQVLEWGNAVEVEKDHLKIGEKHIAICSVRKWPAKMRIDKMYSLVGDYMTGSRGVRDNFMITLNVHFPNINKMMGSLSIKRQKINYQAFGPMLKWVPRLATQKYSFDYLFEKLEDGGRPLKAYLQFTVFSDSKGDLERSVSGLKSLYFEQKFQVLQEKYLTLPFFVQNMPLCQNHAIAKQMNRYRTFSSQHVVHLMPVLCDWKGTSTPIMNFTTRNGQLLSLDFYDSLTNYNVCVAAKSGSGKSYVSNNIITSYLSSGNVKFWMIDVGRSYEKLASEIGGEFIVFDENINFTLNPFLLIQNEGETEEEQEKNRKSQTGMISRIIYAMASSSGNLTDFEEKTISMYIHEMWPQYKEDFTITLLSDAFLESEDQRVRDLATKLHPYTEKGAYGSLFSNDKPAVKFNEDFVVLELEELKDKPDLQTVVLLSLISIIQHEMYLGDRSIRKLCAIDEAWDLLGNGGESVAKFLENAYRRFRKYNGSAITITQSINDLYNSSSGAAIAENSSIFMLLAQKEESIDSLQASKRLSFTDGFFKLLKTVHTIPGQYSEIFFYTEWGSGVGRLYVDKFMHYTFSSNPEDITKIKRELDAGASNYSDAIQRIVEKEEQEAKEKKEKESNKNSIYKKILN